MKRKMSSERWKGKRDVLSKDGEPRGLGLSSIKRELWVDQDCLEVDPLLLP